MPDDTGTESTRSDTPSTDESLFGEAADGAAAAVADEQEPGRETAQDGQGADDASDKATEEPQGADNAGDGAADGPQGSGDVEADAPEDGLKVVVSIKSGRTTIGVQQPSSDPHIEAFDGLDEAGVTHEVPAVIERARARWEESPKHPAYERPVPPARRRNRRGQGAAQDAAADGDAAEAQEQQQTLRLF